ncbi:class D sortase [Thalassobacillus sp. C254]|uniref:class D sortase n=1 Tax=Thalassobacillus sp. C254 TaxID=1225341 RepID=UPI0006CF54FE|nr:class D sortase [Thalassobacillus sp. C254]
MEKILIAIIGLGLSMAAFYGYQWYSSSQAVIKIPSEESEELSAHAVAPSENIEHQDPQMSDEVENFTTGEEMAQLKIPSIETGYPVYWGADEETLDQGVGMYVSEWTTTPDEFRHTVVSGHRDTVFTALGDVKEGDSLFIEYENEVYEYAVKDIWITGAEDRTVIVDKETPTLTLTTCYPFDYIGNAPDRYIIQGEMVTN